MFRSFGVGGNGDGGSSLSYSDIPMTNTSSSVLVELQSIQSSSPKEEEEEERDGRRRTASSVQGFVSKDGSIINEEDDERWEGLEEAHGAVDYQTDSDIIFFRHLLLFGTIFLIVGLAVGIPTTKWIYDSSSHSINTYSFPSDSPSIAPSMAPSISPTSSRFANILPILESTFHYTDSLLQMQTTTTTTNSTNISPQYLAAHWIANLDPSNPQRPLDDQRLIQRYILAVFIFSTIRQEEEEGEQPWIYCTKSTTMYYNCHDPHMAPILSSHDECDWSGVYCNDDGFVQSLKPRWKPYLGYDLEGTLPSELCSLSHLLDLNVAHNNIGGTIPSCLLTTLHLNVLTLSDNAFDLSYILNHRGNRFLHTLEIAENSIYSGITLPNDWLSECVNLKYLNISMNDIRGTIPLSFETFDQLVMLDMSHNQFQGTLSTNLWSSIWSHSIEELYLQNNSFAGNVPWNELVLEWTKLQIIKLSYNQLSGVFPMDTIVIRNWTLSKDVERRKYYWLDHNEFSGTVPSSFGSIDKLRELKLHGNKFTGTMPSELCSIRGNSFSDLMVLTADCHLINCSCCSMCF